MRIMVVSRSWPAYERSGVSLAAHKHAKMLIDTGYEVHIVGADAAIAQEELSAPKYFIPSSGSGALYAPIKVDEQKIGLAIDKVKPDLIILEAWQTALTETFIDVAAKKKISTLMISHGISIHPYTHSMRNWIRYFAWMPYQWFSLPSRLQKLSAISALNVNVDSPRFYDRDLALSLGKPVFELTNSPALNILPFKTRPERRNQVLVVGYFSEVKNQLQALRVLSELPQAMNMVFVGKKEGAYYQRCLDYVQQQQLATRALFFEDHEIDLAKEFCESLLVLQTSITEALPITLLEAMASGTPFVATAVGAASALQGGIHANTLQSQIQAIKRLFEDEILWDQLSRQGRATIAKQFTDDRVKEQLISAVEKTCAMTPKGE